MNANAQAAVFVVVWPVLCLLAMGVWAQIDTALRAREEGQQC